MIKRFEAFALLFLLACAAPLTAQCSTPWRPGEGIAGTNGVVMCSTMWDPDGPGPAAALLVVGGQFTLAGAAQANHVATYDLVTGTFAPLSSGVGGLGNTIVYALDVGPNGNLVVGGLFRDAGGVAVNGIAQWDGAVWSDVGGGVSWNGFNGSVSGLSRYPNGDLVVAGVFTQAGAVAAKNIARWDGASWSPLGIGLDFSVDCVKVLPSGDVAAGGGSSSGGVFIGKCVRYDGVSWSSIGSPMSASIRSMDVRPNGDLVVGSAGGMIPGTSSHVARWDGSSWHGMAVGGGFGIESVLALSNGDVIAGGAFGDIGGVTTSAVARWDGASWHAMGNGLDANIGGAGSNVAVRTLTVLSGGSIFAGGSFRFSGPVAAPRAAIFGGAQWLPLRPYGNPASTVHALHETPAGDLIVGGRFASAGTVVSKRIARWDGTTWTPMTGLSENRTNGVVEAITSMPNGDLVVGGFLFVGPTAVVTSVARWDGTNWNLMANPQPIHIEDFAWLPSGELVAVGEINSASGEAVTVWNGSTWSNPIPQPNLHVHTAVTMPNGDLVVGGEFTMAGNVTANRVARWDGTSWSAVGSGIGTSSGSVEALVVLSDGSLVAGGSFTAAGGSPAANVARWDGSSWSSLSANTDGRVEALLALPNGDIVATGLFETIGGQSAPGIARWDGSSWSAFGSGIDGIGRDLLFLSDGDLLVGGTFPAAGGQVSANLARLATTCPASATESPTSCVGPNGPMSLSTDGLPWLGAHVRSVATGFAPISLGVGVTGLQALAPTLPLTSVHPTGLASCELKVTPTVLSLVVPTAGAAELSLMIPNTPALVGAQVHQQFVQVELTAGAAIASLSSSNALVLTLGTF